MSRRGRPIVGIGSRAELREFLAPPEPRAQPRPAGRVQPCRSFVSRRTLIGGPAHQTRNDSDLCELLVIASNLAGAFRLPSAFRRLKRRRRGVLCGSAENLLASQFKIQTKFYKPDVMRIIFSRITSKSAACLTVLAMSLIPCSSCASRSASFSSR